MDSKSSTSNSEVLDALIVGAGQYGLALGYELKLRGVRFLIVDRAPRLGESWRTRYDSLVLFTTNRYNALPGLSFPGREDGYPSKEEVAAYLESYALHFKLPILLGADVSGVEFRDGLFEVRSSEGAFQAKTVVLAVGALQKPRIPSVPYDSSIKAFHSSQYRNPSDVRGKKILVVGGGNSGAQIAEELAATKEVTIVARGMPRCIPRTFFGKHFLWWFRILGILNRPSRGKKSNPLIGCSLKKRIQKGDIRFKVGEIKEMKEGEVAFFDGEQEPYDTLIWATGFLRDTSLVSREAHSHPGLFSIGKEQDPRVSSGLLVGTAKEASHVAGEITRYLGRA